MRFALVGAVLASACIAAAQSGTGPFGSTKPDVTIRIREHPTTADMVEITMSAPDYPSDLLTSQVQKLCESLGSGARGLQVFRYQMSRDNPDLTFLKATFATDGLIDRAAGVLRVGPILQAFAGAPEPHTIVGLAILFDGEAPNVNTIRRISNAAFEAEARSGGNPPLIEYRVRLLTQDPSKIEFPTVQPEQKVEPAPSVPQEGIPMAVYVAIGVAGIAAGALVYLALLRGPRPAR